MLVRSAQISTINNLADCFYRLRCLYYCWQCVRGLPCSCQWAVHSCSIFLYCLMFYAHVAFSWINKWN